MLFKRCLNIVGGTSVGAAVFRAVLVDLSQCALDERGGAAEDRGQPHPEYGPRTAQTDGSGDTGDISCPYTGGSGYHERLKGRKSVLVIAGLCHNTE